MSRTILYLVTEDWYFWSHRLPIARAAKRAGYKVVVATAVNRHGERIMEEGFTLARLSLKRSGRNPVSELYAIAELIKLYRTVKPDIAHHVALKPVLYGALAASVAGVPVTVNALAGLGHVFVDRGVKAELVRMSMSVALAAALRRKRSVTIFQNPDDLNRFVENGMIKSGRAVLIKGSGVDINQFTPPAVEPAGTPIVLLPSRMLKTKGVEDFYEAANILKTRNVDVRMVLAGAPDEHNPASMTLERLNEWNEEGIVEYWAHREDMPEVMRQAAVVALPSFYGEGAPKSLIEAASAQRPVVAYDVPGSREIARDGVNGLLVGLRETEALANAIERLVKDEEFRRRLGRAGRKIVEVEFSEERVVEQTLALYESLLETAPATVS